jgi:hypothetical protein
LKRQYDDVACYFVSRGTMEKGAGISESHDKKKGQLFC